MFTLYRFRVSGVFVLLAISRATLLAQEAPLDAAFEQLVQNHAALVSGGQPVSQQVELVARWVEQNDWRALSTRALSWLYIALDEEQVDPNKFSVRWTGTIRAPLTGAYTFSQRRQHHADGALRVSIGGQLVFDSTDAAATQIDYKDYRGAIEDVRYTSEPIKLTAGNPQEFKAEFVFDRARMVSNSSFPERVFPMAILEWQTEGISKQIVPESAYSTPDGQRGLIAEYFDDLQFARRVGTHIDQGVQRIWYKKAVCSSQHRAQAEILAHCWPRIRDSHYLVELSRDEQQTTQGDPFLVDVPIHERQSFLIEVSSRLLRGASATSRREMVDLIGGRPGQLAKLSPFAMAETLSACFPVLEVDEFKDLLTAWSDVRQPDAPRAGVYPGTGVDDFQSSAYEPYRDIGSLLAGPRSAVATDLIRDQLTRPDGSPNLMLIYCAAFSVLANQEPSFDSVYPTVSHDANYNVTDIVNATGSVLERYLYSPFGRVTFLNPNYTVKGSQVTAIGNTHFYTGRERDPETYLQLNRHRFYYSYLGRWLSRDPIEYGSGMNLYEYLGGMPVGNTDPSGLAAGTWNKLCEIGRGCWSVGPWDAWDAAYGDTADDAHDFGRNNGKDSPGCSETNALRHCYWQARLAMEHGTGAAGSIGDAHEYGETSCDSKKDKHNNEIGQGIGANASSIADIEKACLQALQDGRLAVCDDDVDCDGDESCDSSGSDSSPGDSSDSDSSSGDSSDGSSDPYLPY